MDISRLLPNLVIAQLASAMTTGPMVVGSMPDGRRGGVTPHSSAAPARNVHRGARGSNGGSDGRNGVAVPRTGRCRAGRWRSSGAEGK